MDNSLAISGPYPLTSVPPYILNQSTGEDSITFGPTHKTSFSWRKFIQKPTQQRQVESTTITVMISSERTTVEGPTVLMFENLSAEDREARTKTLKLAARIGYLYETDEAFRRELLEAIDEIEAGHFVTFSENGWSEE